jgi:hypothetical protein
MRRGAWSAPRVDVDVAGKIMPSRTATGLAEAAGCRGSRPRRMIRVPVASGFVAVPIRVGPARAEPTAAPTSA